MHTKVKKYSIIMGIITLILVSILAIQVNAADPTTGSITIIAHEQKNGDTTTNPPMEGIEYTIYKVDERCEDIWNAEYYIEENQMEGISKTTGEDGIVVFNNLELGRYYVKATNNPDGVYNNISLVDSNFFLVDVPMTNVEGTGWDYDITIEPKIQTAFGNLELTKVDSFGNPIEGVTFKVQAEIFFDKSKPRSLDDLLQDEWVDYIPEGKSEPLMLTTDEYGKIYLNNLPGAGTDGYNFLIYRLVEVNASSNYVINNNIISNFLFFVNSNGKIITNNNYNDIVHIPLLTDYEKNFIANIYEGENLTTVTYINESPEIVKKVKNSNDEFVDSIGASVTDRLTFRITVDVPMQIYDMSTYKIIDELPQGIVLDRYSIKVEGTTEDGSETIPENMYTLSQDEFEITFDTSKMYNEVYDEYDDLQDAIPIYNNIIITYEATIDKDNVVIGGNGNINTATLEYTNKINEDGEEESTTTATDTAEVHTGAVLLEKVEKGNVSTKLAGAKFKIATTKENAEDGVFVQDETGEDIEVTTGENGQATIEGLKYADDGSDTSYWLVETQAPSYAEDGVTKYYNLLKAPVEVKVGKTTHQSAVQISNGKGFDLPETGSIGLVIFLVVGISIMSVAYVLNKRQKVQE